jgi:hypothetical protein
VACQDLVWRKGDYDRAVADYKVAAELATTPDAKKFEQDADYWHGWKKRDARVAASQEQSLAFRREMMAAAQRGQ